MDVSFAKLVASRGWHHYGKLNWKNPVKGEVLGVQIEKNAEALQIDPHAVAWTRKSVEKLVPDIVGHFPMEISRFVYYFIRHGGKVSGKVDRSKYQASPIPKGGLEIIVDATFTISQEKTAILKRLMDLIDANYESEDFEIAKSQEKGDNEDVLADDDNEHDIVFCMVGEDAEEDPDYEACEDGLEQIYAELALSQM